MESGLAGFRPRPGMTKLYGPFRLARSSPRKRGPSRTKSWIPAFAGMNG
jgi:hypothetical protein